MDQTPEEKIAEEAPVVPAAAPAKVPKKRAPRPKKIGPTLSELIVRAVSASEERSGVSLAALKKALSAGGYDVEKQRARIRIVVNILVNKGTLLRTKGTGASGSFKINKEKTKKPAKKAASIVMKPSAKKLTATKSPKKVVKKTTAAKKAPKKVKKPAAAKTSKKATKSPGKATKSSKKATKSPKKVTKKPAAARKAPAKKAAKPKTKKAAPKKK